MGGRLAGEIKCGSCPDNGFGHLWRTGAVADASRVGQHFQTSSPQAKNNGL